MKIQQTLKTLLVMLVSFCSQTVWGQGVTDVLTSGCFTATGASYTNFEGVTLPSGAEYAGQTAKSSSGAFRLRATSPSGIVSTKSGGTLTSIRVTWNSNSTKGRTLEVYGKNTAYASSADLYSSNSKTKKGTYLGSIVYDGTTEDYLVINGEYTYVGLRSKEGAIYLEKIEITYGGNKKTDQTLIFSSSSCTVDLNVEDFEEPTLSGAMTTVEYSSSNTSVATVDAESGAVTLKGVGETTITATAAESDAYLAGSASYVLTVTDASQEEGNYTGAYALVAEYENGYYALTNAAKGEDALAAIDATPNIVNGKLVMDTDDVRNSISWVITPDTKAGSYTIKTLNGDYLTGTEDGTPLTVDTKKCVWTWSEEYGTWVIGNRSFIYGSASDYFKSFALSNIGKGGYAGATISMPFANGYIRNVASGNIGTICLEYDVDAADVKGAEFYSVLGKRTANGEVVSVLFVKETEGLKAGVPYVFRPTADLLVVAYAEGTSVDNPASANGLYGSFAGESVAEGMYLLSGNKIVKCGTGSKIGANRAYINMDEVPEYSADSNVKPALEIGGNGVVNSIDGIDVVDSGIVDVYSISGVRLRCGVNAERALDGLSKGVYVVNGKKVVVK